MREYNESIMSIIGPTVPGTTKILVPGVYQVMHGHTTATEVDLNDWRPY